MSLLSIHRSFTRPLLKLAPKLKKPLEADGPKVESDANVPPEIADAFLNAPIPALLLIAPPII